MKKETKKLNSELSTLGEKASVSEEYGQKVYKISCDVKNAKRVKRAIVNFLLEIYCVEKKREYLYEKLDFSLSDENLRVLRTAATLDGEDVIQIYVGKENSNIYRPKKELKAFKKVVIKAHQISIG